MKFTDAQLAFLMTKMEITESFISEASVFKVKRKPRTKVEKIVVEFVKCNKLKKNGECCVYKAKIDDLCGKHAPKSVASPLSDEVVSETSSDISNVSPRVIRVPTTVAPILPRCVSCGVPSNNRWGIICGQTAGDFVYGCEKCEKDGKFDEFIRPNCEGCGGCETCVDAGVCV